MERLTIFASFPTIPLTDCIPHGDGLVAYHFLASLAQRGHRIHVVTSRAELTRPFSGDVCLYQMNPSADQPAPGALAYMRWSRRILRDICKNEQVDLIHELNPVLSLYSLAFAGCGLPVVLGPHSSRWMNAGAETFRERAMLHSKLLFKDMVVSRQHQRASAILLSTPAALNNVCHPEELAGRLFLLPPGLDSNEFSPASEVTETAPSILFLANVSARKGIFSLLAAFSALAARMPHVKLVIAGDGPDLPEVRRRVAASPFQDQIAFTGRVERAQVPALMRRCTIYCLPSQGEPFGMTVVEAMGCGKPLVVTDAGGPACIVSDAGGRRVPVGDALRLAGALEELLSRPELCRQMGRHNRGEVERTYAWPVVISRLENIYRSVLGIQSEAAADRVRLEHIERYRGRLGSLTPRPATMARIQPSEVEAQL